jgi:tRNA dimethylallyltransferase
MKARPREAVVTVPGAALDPPAADELIVVVGPTASGKTALALELAKRWNGEIVGADSVQIYRRFDLGSAKPTLEERREVPHHLVDLLDPLDAMDAGRYAELAEQAISEVRSRGRTPIVCGGTFLWVKALVFGLADSGPRDESVRARHAELAEREGRGAVHARLAEVDPASAARLSPNDLVRTSRALEVFELTGRPQSEVHLAHGFREPRHRARLLGVHRDREELDLRIAARTDALLAAGFVDEVRGLLADGYAGARAMGSVGYREVRAYLEGGPSQRELAGAIVRSTRVFVRRQRTWLRDAGVTWVEPD